MSVKLSVTKVFDDIGDKNNAPPDSQDKANNLVHEYNIATVAESYWKKRRENAKKKLEFSFTPVQNKAISDAVLRTKTDEVGDTVNIIETSHNILVLETKNGATYLDEAELRVIMMRKLKMNATEVDALLEKARFRRDPTKSYKVVER